MARACIRLFRNLRAKQRKEAFMGNSWVGLLGSCCALSESNVRGGHRRHQVVQELASEGQDGSRHGNLVGCVCCVLFVAIGCGKARSVPMREMSGHAGRRKLQMVDESGLVTRRFLLRFVGTLPKCRIGTGPIVRRVNGSARGASAGSVVTSTRRFSYARRPLHVPCRGVYVPESGSRRDVPVRP